MNILAGRTLAVATISVVLAGCSAGGPSASQPSIPPGAPRIVANNLAFEAADLKVPAGAAFALVFENKEGVPHNVTILGDGSTGASVFVGEVFSGPATRVYQVPSLSPGMHSFRCDVHPTMTGTLVAAP